MSKAFQIFSWLVLASAMALIVWFSYLLLEPFDEPLVTEPFPVLNENKEVQRGGVLYYQIEFTKYQDVPVTSHKNIICADGNLVTLATTNTDAPVGVHKVVGEITIPEKTSLGECYVQFKTTYHINQFKEEQRERTTEVFNVI